MCTTSAKTGAMVFVAVMATVVCAFPASGAAGPTLPNRPNIVLIVADDMGYSDAGCYGGEIATPNLDRLAAGGLRYTQFYNTGRCWTTRASLLSGLYPHYAESIHMGRRRNVATQLLAELLKPLGYRCYHSGKWHVRGTDPMKRSFDHSFIIRDFNRFFCPKRRFADGQKLPPVERGSGYYLTNDIASRAIGYLKEHAAEHGDQPFFLYLAFTSPHFPLQALPQDIARYRDRYRVGWDALRVERLARMKKMGLLHCSLSPRDSRTVASWSLSPAQLKAQIDPGEVGFAVAWDSLNDREKRFQAAKMAIHAAMIDRMDRNIGRVLDQLDAMRAMDNTMILFLSDNGASAEMINRGDKHDRTAPLGSAGSFLCLGPGWSTAANTPFKLHKSWVHEGGINTPFIVHWPAGVAARGQIRRTPGHVIDIVPTICAIVGAKPPVAVNGKPVAKPQGLSLVGTFQHDQPIGRTFLFWEHIGNRAWREGDWKLVSKRDGPWELYHLADDRSECVNLAGKYPDKVKAMAARWQSFFDQIKR